MIVATAAVKNARPYMEDRFNVCEDVIPNVHLLAVYDGHGGDKVAELCASSFPRLLRKELQEERDRMQREQRQQQRFGAAGKNQNTSLVASSAPSVSLARLHVDPLKKAIKNVDDAGRDADIDMHVGSTACMALIDTGNASLTVANIGDSRLMMKADGIAHALTKDHNPRHPGEQDRLRRANAVVAVDPFGTERVMGLNLTRSLGDRFARPFVSPNPVVSKFSLTGNEDYLVIASDGLWDVMSVNDVMHVVDEYLQLPHQPHNVARELVHVAMQRGSTDNITVLWAAWAVRHMSHFQNRAASQ